MWTGLQDKQDVFAAEAELHVHGFILCFHKANAATREIKIRSILLILSENMLVLSLR